MTPTPKTWQGQPIVIDGEMLMQTSGGVAVRALELLMRHRGMFVDRAQVEQSGAVTYYTLDLGRELNDEDDEAMT